MIDTIEYKREDVDYLEQFENILKKINPEIKIIEGLGFPYRRSFGGEGVYILFKGEIELPHAKITVLLEGDDLKVSDLKANLEKHLNIK